MRLESVAANIAAATAVAALATVGGCSGNKGPTRVAFVSSVYDCAEVIGQAPTLVVVEPTPSGLGEEAAPADVAAIPDDKILDKALRKRAALLCACRAEQARESNMGTWADAFTVVGGVGTIGGGVLNGIAASESGAEKRKNWATAGAVSLGTGALAFGLNTALNLSGRAREDNDSATEQEIAAAVLLNDDAGAENWGRAWLMCVTSTNASTGARLNAPQASFEPKSKNSPVNADAGAPQD
jgi:hypothetical protein